MRLRGASLGEIAQWLREQGYPRKTKHTTLKKLVINVKFISDLLRNSIYMGVMKYGKQVVSILDKYDFVPIVSVEDFGKLCKENEKQRPIC